MRNIRRQYSISGGGLQAGREKTGFGGRTFRREAHILSEEGPEIGRESNMKEGMKIGFVGGDARMLRAARIIAEEAKGAECAVWGFDAAWDGERDAVLVRCAAPESAVREADALVLPLPVTRDGTRLNAPLAGSAPELLPLIREMKPGGTLFGGKIPSSAREMAAERGIAAVDYFEDEAFQIRNAVPTAEGAVAACIGTLPVTVAGMRAAVLGYGRVGRTLAQRLKALGAEVCAAARNPRDLAWAEADGCRPVPLARFLSEPPRCEAVFNTIPARLFDGETLGRMGAGTVVFDLANTETAETNGVRVIPLPSLPGKTAPETAGEIIGRAVLMSLEKAAEGGTV